MSKGPGTGGLGALVRQSGLYALGNASLKVAGFFLAPILLNPGYLAVSDYGYLALLLVTAQFGTYVAGLGLSTGLLRHTSIDDADLDREALPFTALVATAVSALLLAAVLVGLARPIASLLLDDPARAPIIRLLAVYVGFKVVASVPLVRLRVQERAGIYAAAVAAEVTVLVVLVAIALPVLGEGLVGVMAAYAGSAGAAALVLTAGMLQGSARRFSRAAIRPLLVYGAPLVVASLAGWFLNAGDRYLLAWMADEVALAGYEWASRLGGLVNVLFVQSFQLAFTVLGLKAIGAGDPSMYRRTLRHYVAITGGAVLGLGLFTADGMRLLIAWFDVDAHYAAAGRLVFPIALGFLTYGIYIIVNNILLADGKTGRISVNVAIAAGANILLNLLLIPGFGAMGAAVATVLSYGVLAGITARMAQQSRRIAYPWGVIVIVIGMIIPLFVAGLAVDAWSAMPRIGGKVVLLAVYPLALWLLRVYRPEDVRAARRVWERLSGRGDA